MPCPAGLLARAADPDAVVRGRGYCRIAGIDEAGRGPLAGPVVAAAVVLPPDWHHPGIADSKTLPPTRREHLFGEISQAALDWNWAAVEPGEIDRINILQASLRAMQQALQGLTCCPDYVLVDGPHPVATDLPQTALPKADSLSLSVGAASILAKVIRDAIMQQYHTVYPHYDFARNKGYGTAAHRRALQQRGCCRIHRMSFAGVVSQEDW